MFARSMCRAAAPLRQPVRKQIRTYASESSKPSGIGIFGYTAVAALVGAGGYYYFANVQGKAPPVPVPEQLKGKIPGSEKKAFTGGDQGFLSLKLDSVEDVNHNTKKFRFALPESDQISGLHVASALLTKVQKEGDEKPTLRPYTPVSDEGEQGFIDLMIKQYPNGPMSEHIHALKPGDTLEIKGPLPKYEWQPNKHDHVAMIAGGTGITPMYQVMRSIFNNPDDNTKVTLVFGNITEKDILLREEFNKLENTYPRRFRAFYVLDDPPEGWEQGKGYITKDMLKTVLPEPKEENIKIFVCGPPGLYKAVSGEKKSPQDQGEHTGILKELGYSQDQVYKF